jgi:hypothetical protein
VTLADLSSLGSFISGVAVVVSLAYLSVQIRQNTKHSQALIQQGRAARIVDTALRLAELRADDGLNTCFEGAPQARARDVSRFLNVARAVFISAEDSFLQSEEGLLGPAALESYKASLRRGTGSPGLAAAWILTRDMYEPKFRAFMNETNGDLNQAVSVRLAEAWRTALASPAQTSVG